jgi:single-strand DNA-binding protein
MLIGNTTRDPELRTLPSGTVVCDFGLATNRKYKTGNGEEKEEVAFIDCSAFGRVAEVIAQYAPKGRSIFVEGRLHFESWEDKNGNKRNKLSVIVENFQFVGGKKADGAGGDEYQGEPQQPAKQAPPKTAAPATGYGSRRPPAKQPTDASMRPSNAARIMAADHGEGLDDTELPF